ncbi:hypothetical protein KFE80_10470 [bacterium SCSIO 12696]|nr:hypothetical protein KFE80_10470 [bacterium SCSIO 12696]
MSASGGGTQNKHPSASVNCLTQQLVPLYDEMAELEALNSFLYDAFLTLATEADDAFSASTSSGLGLTCQWLRQRQQRLKREFHQLIQCSKEQLSAHNNHPQ